MKADDTENDRQNDSPEGDDTEMYQHIKEAKDETTQVKFGFMYDMMLLLNQLIQILDVATKEQAESQKTQVTNKEDEYVEKPTESSEDIPPEENDEAIDTTESMVKDAEKVEREKNNKSKKKQHPEGRAHYLLI